MKESRGDQPHELSVKSIEVTGQSSAVSLVRNLAEVEEAYALKYLPVGISYPKEVRTTRRPTRPCPSTVPDGEERCSGTITRRSHERVA